MAHKLHNGLHAMGVLITERQFRLIAAIHRIRNTPETRVSKATVMREALTTGLEEQAIRFNVPTIEETERPE